MLTLQDTSHDPLVTDTSLGRPRRANTAPATLWSVTHVLLATDADALAEDVFAALAGDDTTVSRVRAGVDVGPAVAELRPDLVILDLQIGNMGGVATSLDLRYEAEAGRLPNTKILMLLDRDADRWISTQAQADAELVKPVTAFKLARVAQTLTQPAHAD